MAVKPDNNLIPIKDLIDRSFRVKNGIDYFNYNRYGNRAMKIVGSYIDQYQEFGTKNQHEYVILYDIEEKRYRRIRKHRILDDVDQYDKPDFSEGIYYIQLYTSYGIFIDFIDEYDDEKYIVHVPGENKYRIIRQDIIKTNYAKKM